MLSQIRSRVAQAALKQGLTPFKPLGINQVRGIKLHEYQAGNLLDKYKVSIPLGEVAFTSEEAHKIASKFDNGCVVKSQILGGGRGMGHIKETGYQGGVKVVDTAE